MAVEKPAILFLCLGNICRSPLAEGAARAAFAQADIQVHLDSAGTSDWHIGRAPDLRAQAEAKRRGTDISDLRGRQLQRSDFYEFDLILAADDQNIIDASTIMPDDATAKLQLMLDWAPDSPRRSVTDPYYGDDDGFAETWADVSAMAEGLVRAYRQG